MRSKTKKFGIGRALTYAILIIGALAALFPFIWLILTSFKTASEAMRIPPTLLPENFSFLNY